MFDTVALDEGHKVCDSDIMIRTTLQMHHVEYLGLNPAAVPF